MNVAMKKGNSVFYFFMLSIQLWFVMSCRSPSKMSSHHRVMSQSASQSQKNSTLERQVLSSKWRSGSNQSVRSSVPVVSRWL